MCMVVVVIETTTGSRTTELRPGTFALTCAEDHVLEKLALGGLKQGAFIAVNVVIVPSQIVVVFGRVLQEV